MFRLLLALVPLVSPLLGAVPPSDPHASNAGSYATYFNNVQDLLDGQDGVPLHPADFQGSGKLAVALDVDGNAIEQAEAHISYYEGRYYLYSTYSSPDMTSLKLVDFSIPNNPTITPTKPVVRYSNTTKTYVMLLGNQALTDLYYLVSKSPSGPFRGPQDANTPGVLFGPYIGHDFDIAEGPDGTHWILTDTFGTGVFLPIDGSSQYPTTVPITWDVAVQKLNPDLTSLAPQSTETIKLIFSARELATKGLSVEASSSFHRDGYYYMLFAYFCVPECAGRSMEEIDWLFANRVSAKGCRKHGRINLLGDDAVLPRDGGKLGREGVAVSVAGV